MDDPESEGFPNIDEELDSSFFPKMEEELFPKIDVVSFDSSFFPNTEEEFAKMEPDSDA